MSAALRITAGAALALAACSAEPTYLLTTIERGNVPADTQILGLETTIELGGRHDMTPLLQPPPGSELAMPTTLTLELAEGTGTVRVGANAYGANDLLLSAGSTELTLAPGEIIPVTVVLGTNSTPPPDGGVDESMLAISPDFIDFSTLTAGTEATQTFTVGNSGSGPSKPLRIAFADENVPFSIVDNDCADVALPRTEACTFGVRFQPLAVNSWATTIAVEGYDFNNGINGAAVLFSLDPPELDFGAVSTTVSATVTVSNPSTSESTRALTFTIDGPDRLDFAYTLGGGNCDPGEELAPGTSCTVTIDFAPGSPGARNATFKVTDRATMHVALSGSGV